MRRARRLCSQLEGVAAFFLLLQSLRLLFLGALFLLSFFLEFARLSQ